MKTRIGILGYGNLGRGVECAVRETNDMELAAVFTRREPSTLTIRTENVPVVSADELPEWKDRIDVLIICGGSATDLPKQTPEYAKYFNVIDSFDTHANIPAHFANVDAAAKESGAKWVVVEQDQPSMGLSPLLVSEIFHIIEEINQKGTTVLLVEQNAKRALAIANRAYVLETGKITLSGTGEELARDERVQKAYLGG